MKKLTYEGWVSSFIEHLFQHFDFVGWEIKIEHEKQPAKERNGDVYASINVEPIYQMAVITCYPEVKSDFDKGNMADMVQRLTHEVVHVFLAPFQDFIEPHLSEVTAPYFTKVLEQQTQKLTMVFLKTLPESLIPPR